MTSCTWPKSTCITVKVVFCFCNFSSKHFTFSDPLPKPVVNCVVNDTHITLVCSVALPAQFSWSGPNGYTHSGDRVYIARKATGDSIYYCTADNDVSRNVTEFNIVKDCIKGKHLFIY